MSASRPEPTLTTRQLAELWQVGAKTICRRIARKQIPGAFYDGHEYRIPVSAKKAFEKRAQSRRAKRPAIRVATLSRGDVLARKIRDEIRTMFPRRAAR